MANSSVEKLIGLKRKLQITVPAEVIKQEFDQRLTKIAKTAKVAGFRPGKVPAQIIEKRYGQNVLIEVAQELLPKHFSAAVEEHDLLIVGQPSITPGEIKRNQPFEFSAEFEVYPEITLADMSGERLERLKVELQEKDIDKMVEVIQKQQATWEEVDRAAEQGDRVVIDFEGYIDGEKFDNGSAKDFQVELGSKQMIEGFEAGLLGAKPGDEREVKCTFPDDYTRDALAGKEASFQVKVSKVQVPSLPEVNDEFAKTIGFEGGVVDLKKDVEKNMMNQVEQVLKNKVKTVVMDKLLELNSIDIPAALIDSEIENLQKVTKQQQGKQESETADLPREQFEEQARRRVTLGLLLGEVIKKHELKADPQKVRERVELIASVYHEPEKIIQWYYSNDRLLAEVESLVLEDQAVDRLLEQMQVVDKFVSYDEAVEQSKQQE